MAETPSGDILNYLYSSFLECCATECLGKLHNWYYYSGTVSSYKNVTKTLDSHSGKIIYKKNCYIYSKFTMQDKVVTNMWF